MFTALSEWIVVVADTNAAETVLPQLASCGAQANANLQRPDAHPDRILLENHPLHNVLTSMPAVKVRTKARIFTEVAGKEF